MKKLKWFVVWRGGVLKGYFGDMLEHHEKLYERERKEKFYGKEKVTLKFKHDFMVFIPFGFFPMFRRVREYKEGKLYRKQSLFQVEIMLLNRQFRLIFRERVKELCESEEEARMRERKYLKMYDEDELEWSMWNM